MKIFYLFVVALFTFVSTASAQTASFGRFRDATPGKYYDIIAAVDDGSGTLTIPLGSGVDANFNNNAFYASNSSGVPGNPFVWAFNPLTVTDTVSVFVVAPEGYIIDSVTLDQTGARSTSRGNQTFTTTTLVVNDVPSAPTYQTPNLSLTVSDVGASSATVVVSTTLAASPGGATVTSASLTVSLTPQQ